MSIKNIYNLLALLLAYGLIIGGFIVLGASLEERVKILDIVASCLIFTQFAQIFVLPMINMSRTGHREVGMMGIHYYFVGLCCVLSVAVMIFGILQDVEFKYQLVCQLVVLFLLLVGRVSVLRAGEKVQQVYEMEENAMSGKKNLRAVMDDFMDYVATIGELDPTVKSRLSDIQESLRFVTPSSNPDAKNLECQFSQIVEDLKMLMRDTTMNGERITDETEHLARILLRRKKY
jgi:hypothetical protein